MAGNRILITASSDGVALVDRATGRTPFWGLCANAHSADLLPGERIAVACSVRADGRQPTGHLRRPHAGKGTLLDRTLLGPRCGLGRAAQAALGACGPRVARVCAGRLEFVAALARARGFLSAARPRRARAFADGNALIVSAAARCLALRPQHPQVLAASAAGGDR